MDEKSAPFVMDLSLEYPELQQIASASYSPAFNLPSIFPDRTGFGVKGANKKRIGYINKALPLLLKMLYKEEVVEYVARGVFTSLAEHFTGGGIWIRYLNITFIVATNFRIIFINTDSKGVPKNMNYSYIRYSNIVKATAGTFGGLGLKLANRATRNYSEVPKRDAKHFKEIIEKNGGGAPAKAIIAAAGMPTGVEHLCTTCFGVVPEGQYSCPNCRTEFATPPAAAVRALIFPALGDAYLKKSKLFVGVKAVSLAIVYLAFVIVAFDEASKGGNVILALLPLILIIGLIHAMNGAATYFSAKKGLVPLKQPVTAPMAGGPM